jgi:hypothetical protein
MEAASRSPPPCDSDYSEASSRGRRMNFPSFPSFHRPVRRSTTAWIGMLVKYFQSEGAEAGIQQNLRWETSCDLSVWSQRPKRSNGATSRHSVILDHCGFRPMFLGCSQIMWAHSQLMWSREADYSQLIWSQNSGCFWARRFMFSGRYS